MFALQNKSSRTKSSQSQSKSHRQRRRQVARRSRLARIERLDDRKLMAADVTFSDGVVEVSLDDNDSHVEIKKILAWQDNGNPVDTLKVEIHPESPMSPTSSRGPGFTRMSNGWRSKPWEATMLFAI